ncbi:MAG: hypothetical protein LBQ51_08995 [Desulfovibrio sp.]|jgi:hypothetical protein|nr:hypothetical protein [Desulfovibrio sp.]
MKRNVLIPALVVLTFALAFTGTGCKRTVPIENFGNSSLVAYGSLKATDVRDAVIRGGSNIGWQMSEERPGLVVAVWKARDHSLTVEIPYSSTAYTIKYRSSVNMSAENGEIHRNYNRWIERLERNINAELSKVKK